MLSDNLELRRELNFHGSLHLTLPDLVLPERSLILNDPSLQSRPNSIHNPLLLPASNRLPDCLHSFLLFAMPLNKLCLD